VNRAEAKLLTDAWVRYAAALLDAGHWHAAYYLAGYSVECGLKACVLLYIENSGIIFRDKKFVERCFTHDLAALVKAADLEIDLGVAIQASSQFEDHWLIVKDWNPDVRYQMRSETDARELFRAITDNANGMLPWIKARW
jgi:HEPN domain-containing protein